MPIHFRALSAPEVRSHSFGHVDNPTLPRPDGWQRRKHTLFDPAVFGHEQDWTCACEKFVGERHSGMICDRCGVKVTIAAAARRHRFGHIALRENVPHPLVPTESLTCIPVLPIAFRGDKGRHDLDYLYANVLRTNATDSAPLDAAVAALFHNESLTKPVYYPDRIACSLAFHAFPSAVESSEVLVEPGCSMEELGIYLTALALKIEREP